MEMRVAIPLAVQAAVQVCGGSRSLPIQGLLAYLARPNSDEYLIGESTDVGEATYIWGYYLGDDETIRAATGWTVGNANVFYDAGGAPVVCLATEIMAWAGINTGTVLFKMINETQQTGKLAVYAAGTDAEVIANAKIILKVT